MKSGGPRLGHRYFLHFYTFTLPTLLRPVPLVPVVFRLPNWLPCLHPSHLPLRN